METVFGRRLVLPDIKSNIPNLRQGAERAAINAPMQGTAADIIKRAMIRVDAWQPSLSNVCKMLLQVHDELVFEVECGAKDEIIALIKDSMENAADLAVPLTVEIGSGRDWFSAH